MEEKEPSVLDFLKSKLKSTLNLSQPESEKVEIPESVTPAPKPAESSPIHTDRPERPDQPDQADQGREVTITLRIPTLPWRTFFALILGLIAQLTLDPTGFSLGPDTGTSLRESDYHTALVFGLIFYGLAAAFLLWAYFAREFALPALPDDQPETDPQTAQRLWIALALVLAFVDFFLLGNNLFTPLNATLWLAALALFMRGVWLHPRQPSAVPAASEPFTVGGFLRHWWDVILLLLVALMGAMGFGGDIFLFGMLPFVIALLIIWRRDPQAALTPAQRIRAFFQRDSWQITLTRWTLLILAIAAVIIFFRFYRLEGVIAEPFSDQAEKLLDVNDLIQGQTHIFFERNTGREFDQFYWTAMLVWLMNTGISFITLKTGTVLIGLLTLPYVYLLGKEIGGKRVALFALILAGVAYWPNTISRIGLRFPLYPAFVAPTLYYLVKGLRLHRRNDFILAGLFMGFGINGYSPFRFVPFVVVAAVGLYMLHKSSEGKRRQALMLSAIMVMVSFLVFVPLFRYSIEHPEMFSERALTRLTDAEQPLPVQDWCPSSSNTAMALCIFSTNTAKAWLMFFWDNGSIWVHSIPGRPALDVVAAVLFGIGYVLLLVRYARERRWQDLFLFIAVPMLLMPSILSLAFPDENPSLNRTGGAFIVVFVVAAMGLEGLYQAFRGARSKGLRPALALGTVIVLLGLSAMQSYDLVFNKFDTQFRAGAWNTSDMGRVMKAFMAEGNSPDNAWVIPYPYWVDTRLVGIQSGLPTKDFAINREDLPNTLSVTGTKLFIIKKGDNPDGSDTDTATLDVLRQLYPSGSLGVFDSPLPGKDFWIYTVPAAQPANP